jgi:hypothetical protein
LTFHTCTLLVIINLEIKFPSPIGSGKFIVSQLAFPPNIPPKNDISVQNIQEKDSSKFKVMRFDCKITNYMDK